MTRSPRMLAVVAAAVVIPMMSVTVAHADGNSTRIVGASLDTTARSLTAGQTATLTVSLHLQDPNGVQPTHTPASIYDQASPLLTCPCVQLAPVDDSGNPDPANQQSRLVELHLSAGSASDGIWTGTTVLGAVSQGQWGLTRVFAGTLKSPYESQYASPSWTSVNPFDLQAVVAVSGRDWPVVTVDSPARTVRYGTSYVLSGQVRTFVSDTPVPDFSLLIIDQIRQGALEIPSNPTVAHTDANGHWSVVEREPGFPLVFLTPELYAPEVGLWQGAGPVYPSGRLARAWVSWAVVTHVVRRGTARALTVTASPALKGASVQLQRRTSSGWRVVDTEMTDSRGHTAFVVHSGSVYRVRALGYYFLIAYLGPATTSAVRVP